jgi:hypothetical protein
MLNECACGEPLLDQYRTCPQCGKKNPGHRQARWRLFWPDLDTMAGADEAIQLGYWAAFIALCGVGIQRRWRSAACVGFLLFLANLAFSLSRGGGIGVITFFIFVGLVNGVRGAFAHATLSKQPPAAADVPTGV